MNDDFQIDLLKFIDSNLDNFSFLEGFCQFYGSNNLDEKFLNFLSSTLKYSPNIDYLKTVLTILNKLFQKSFEHQNGCLNDCFNLILKQINRLADVNLEKLFSFIIQENNFDLKFILQKFIKNLIQSKIINESLTLGILNSLIKLTGMREPI